MDQYYRIAGLTVKMDAFGFTRDLAQPYSIDSCSRADITIEVDFRDLKAAYPNASEEIFEYLVTGRDFYSKLVDHAGMMLHASAIAVDGRAYLFSADSGVGKTTHTRLWRQVFGEERVAIINDDKPALRFRDGVWYAYGTPWSGKYGLNQNLCCPVAGICFLERGSKNRIEPYTNNDIIFRFLKQTYRSGNEQYSDKLLSLIESLLEKIPVWRLECNMEPEAAYTAWEAMTKGAIF
ncbi:MAG: hypothetical protein IJ412_01900 [Oscillospiraceae bacterium]|nr:hypothetical protein [Oscillospiraceae bacterium]